jgi:glycosyltransferase involved in cell wall biosynthesis
VEVLRAAGHIRHHPAHPVALGLPPAVTGFDVIHAHQLWATPSRVAAIVARLRHRRLAVTDHGLLGPRPRPLAHRLVHRFLTVSQYSADVLGVPQAKTTVVHGGVDPLRLSPGPPGARSGVLFVGRLTPHKGVDRLLEALPAGAELTVVGTAGHDPDPPESAYLPRLQHLAAQGGRQVRFLGAVSDPELVELYRRASVVVLPSVEVTCYGKRVAISELLGLTVLEAMACATPVVASRLGGLREVVRHGETGFLTAPGDVEDLRARLQELLGHPSVARQMGDSARQLATERFTWDACARRCLEAYEPTGGGGG